MKVVLDRFCPNCQTVSNVLETRRTADGHKRRRRQCTSCGKRWTSHDEMVLTQESIRAADLKVGSVVILSRNLAWIEAVSATDEGVRINPAGLSSIVLDPDHLVDVIGLDVDRESRDHRNR